MKSRFGGAKALSGRDFLLGEHRGADGRGGDWIEGANLYLDWAIADNALPLLTGLLAISTISGKFVSAICPVGKEGFRLFSVNGTKFRLLFRGTGIGDRLQEKTIIAGNSVDPFAAGMVEFNLLFREALLSFIWGLRKILPHGKIQKENKCSHER
ncbi:hypothetical protein [Paenibacillus sp. YN15]|uniref:hypothetical protein n=1 Tax=Paenibacillus sp. YN15 TaxID=1742774 RepID=UPI000DCB1550|nr:hypothetical protein [Paenibacillus sp. YN15]RAV05648.1 hypothetical protein DQG13_03260 [Paenibacillus sp. YN15]